MLLSPIADCADVRAVRVAAWPQYSFCLQTILDDPSNLSTHTWRRFPTLLSRLLLLILLLVVQVTYAYAFYDSSMLLFTVSVFPAYADPLHASMFYPGSVVGEVGAIGPFPLVNVVVSLASLAILTLYMKQDTEGCVFDCQYSSRWSDCQMVRWSDGRSI